MSQTPPSAGTKPLTADELKSKIRQAELLAKKERFADASEIYHTLIVRLHTQMMASAKQGKTPGPSTQKALRFLQTRLNQVQERLRSYQTEQLPPDLASFRNRLENADLYARKGLTAEAAAIYTDLVERIRSWQEYREKRRPATVEAADRAVALLEGRISALHEATEGLQEEAPLEFDTQVLLCLAAAVLGNEQGLAALDARANGRSLDPLLSNAMLALAGHMDANGLPALAIALFTYTLRKGVLSEERRLATLEKLAASYEQVGNRRKAVGAYAELLSLDRSRTDVQQRIKALRKDIRQIHLNITTVADHPRFFFGLSVLIALVFMAFIPYTKTVNNVDYFTLENHPEIQFYDGFKEIFGSDEFFVAAYEQDRLFTEENLLLLTEITEALEDNVREAEEVKSLANVNDIVGEEGYFEVREFLEDIPSDPAELDRIKQQATTNPFYVNNLISKDGRTTSIVIRAEDAPEDPDYRKRLLEQTQSVLAEYEDRTGGFHLAGWTFTNLKLSEYMNKDVSTFIPLTYLFITLAIWLVFRSVTLTALAILNISVCVGSVMGLFGLTGIELNNVTSIIPSMVMALALCDTVHIFSHMDRRTLNEAGGDRRRALASVLKRIALPSFLTSLTTAIGFLSQAVSEIPPIRSFAWIASAGMLFEFLYSFFFLPPLLLLFKPEKIYLQYSAKKGMTRILSALFNLVHRHHLAIAVVIGLIIGAAGWYTLNIRVESTAIGCFKASSPLRQSLDYVEERLGGVDSLDISLKAAEIDAFKDPENLELIQTIQEHADTLPGVDDTFSFVDFLKDMNESFHDENPDYNRIPETRDMVSQFLLLYSAEDIEDVINNTYDHTRIGLRISLHKTSEQERLIGQIRDFIDRNIHAENIEIRVTGRAMKDVITIGSLVEGQVYSLALATGLISLIMFLALKSFSIGFLSLLPNTFPIIVNFGIMGLFGIPLDMGTAIIAAVAIGIAVDDTIHFLSEYKDNRNRGMAIPRAVQAVIFLKGRALFSSSLILCIGFSVLVLSHFVPTMNFGILTAIIMLTAMIGDIVFLPSVLMLKKKS